MTIEEYYNSRLPEINKIKEWGEEVFGEGKIDIQRGDVFRRFSTENWEESDWRELSGEFLIAYIHIPEKTVTNEYGRTHKVYDGYVKFSLNANLKLRDYPLYTRSRMTKKEIISGYAFSHAYVLKEEDLIYAKNHPNSAAEQLFKNLCFGSGPIVTSISRIREVNSEENWRIFFNDLDSYLEVESISGGPYVRMESINGSEIILYLVSGLCNIDRLTPFGKSVINHFLIFLNEEHWFDNITYYNSNGIPKIQNALSELYESLNEYFSKFKDKVKDFYYKTDNDVPFDIQDALRNLTCTYKFIEENRVVSDFSAFESSIDDNLFPIDMGFTFNGEPVKFTILEDTESSNSENKKGLRVDIFNRLMHSLSNCSLWFFDYDTDTAYL